MNTEEPKVNHKKQSVSDEAIRTLAGDVALLADYASKNKITVEGIDEINKLVFDYAERKYSPHDRDELIEFYGTLSSSLGEVNVDSLRATAGFLATPNHGKSKWRWYTCWRYFSFAGRYLTLLWLFTLIGVVLIGYYYYLDYAVDGLGLLPGEDLSDGARGLLDEQSKANFFLPFTYGLLGACAYLMRLTGKRLRDRTFDPQHIPEHMNRLVLGVLSGGIIILFVDNPDKIPVSQAAIGFLAGYSIDFFFQTLERIINAIMPKVGLDSVARKMDRNKIDLMINRYSQKLAKSTDPGERQMLEALIKDLRT